jgi:hypothetical protein
VQQLKILQSMWAMERRQPDGIERTLEENLQMIYAAGFDGVSMSFEDRDQARRAGKFLAARGMVIEAQCFPQTVDDLRPVLDLALEVGVDHIDLQPNVRPRKLADCLPLLDGWARLAEDRGVNLVFETHRDRMTTDLHFTLDLLDAFPRLRLLADLSHFLVGREFPDPPRAIEHEMIQRILDHSWGLHGRVASREQVQIPISFAHHQRWVDLFLGWWEYGFRSWRKRAPADGVLCFTCELGPQPYAIIGADGCDLTDRWQEALLMREQVRALWARVSGDLPRDAITTTANKT